MKASYEDRFCLFLDILGFRDLVNDSVKVNTTERNVQASEIFFSLNEIADTLNYGNVMFMSKGKLVESTRKVSQFSDSIVVSYSTQEVSGLVDILYDVLLLQLVLVRRGLLVRGSVTRGQLYHESDFVFGPALNEAVELEKLAMYPRVVIDQDLLVGADLIGPRVKRAPSGLFARDLDGLFYVDYFNVLPEYFNESWSEMVEYLLSLRNVVKSLSRKKVLSVKMKHSWMREKYNHVAEKIKNSQYAEYNNLAVPDDELDHIINVSPF